MKRLLIILVSISLSYLGRAQIMPEVQTWGLKWPRGGFDSVVYVPTGCGAPSGIASLNSYGITGLGQKIRQAAIYADTCGHHVYWFDWTDSAWSRLDGSAGGSGFSMHTLTSSNFSTSVNCPLPALNNDSLQIFWNDLGRFLQEGSEWQNLSGGGFSILVPGFNASSNSYSLTLYANNIASPPGPVNFTSSSFSTSTSCPIPADNGMTLQIFWNDAQRYLVQGVDWTPLAGGGFTITISGFNASTTNYSFYVFAQ